MLPLSPTFPEAQVKLVLFCQAKVKCIIPQVAGMHNTFVVIDTEIREVGIFRRTQMPIPRGLPLEHWRGGGLNKYLVS